MNHTGSKRQIEKFEGSRDKTKIVVDLLSEIDKLKVSDFGTDPLETDILINFYVHFLTADSSYL